jgi:hypothetical protein
LTRIVIELILIDYRIDQGIMMIYCDNTGDINPHNILGSNILTQDIILFNDVESKIVSLDFVPIEQQLAYLFSIYQIEVS